LIWIAKTRLVCFNTKPEYVAIEDDPLTEYLTEQEQIEMLKNWIKQYSLVILAGFALAAVAITGWRYCKHVRIKLSAMLCCYDEMILKRTQNEPAAVLVQTDKLFTHYAQTAYGQFAALMLGRAAVLNHDIAGASKQLNWVINNGKIASVRQIARLRLARYWLANKNG